MLTVLTTIVAFLALITIIVFIHEFGHYIVAKACGVRVTTFSIGFGKELWGFNDRSGTRWKLSLLPFGGYVKMFGDATEASTPAEDIAGLPEEEKKKTFYYKPLYQKAAIVAAGPLANFILAIVIITGFVVVRGVAIAEPVIVDFQPDMPAASSELRKGDRITQVDGRTIRSFSDISRVITPNLGTPVVLHVQREGQELDVTVTPKMITEKGAFGEEGERATLGIIGGQVRYDKVSPPRAVWEATLITYQFCENTLKGIGQMITGERDVSKNIKGPLGMAKMSGAAAEHGWAMFLIFMATLSANLGLINLFPIPILDGGHLMFYAIEGISRRKLNKKLQEYSFRVGMALISMLMAYAIINDIWGVFK